MTLVADQVFAAEIDSQASGEASSDYHRATLSAIPKRPHDLPPTVAGRCRELARRLELGVSAVDLIRSPLGRYYFLEINTGPAWRWIENETGQRITAAVADVLTQGCDADRS